MFSIYLCIKNITLIQMFISLGWKRHLLWFPKAPGQILFYILASYSFSQKRSLAPSGNITFWHITRYTNNFCPIFQLIMLLSRAHSLIPSQIIFVSHGGTSSCRCMGNALNKTELFPTDPQTQWPDPGRVPLGAHFRSTNTLQNHLFLKIRRPL